MIIIGAGMAGLLAAGMLRDEATSVFEAQPSLPNNHTALLRFRSSVVGDVLNIPFKKVSVMKAVETAGLNPIAAMLSYSLKTNGTATMRSSISAQGDINERFIAPPDFIQQMVRKVTCPIIFNAGVSSLDVIRDKGQPAISTIPMSSLMDILEWPGDRPDFLHVGGYNITAELENVDAYCTLYIPDRLRQENRISLTGNRLTIEVALPALTNDQVKRLTEKMDVTNQTMEALDYAAGALGLWGSKIKVKNINVRAQRYAKILPIDESIRRNFIIWASETHGVYSLGRYATWRPGLLLDDLVADVRVIQKLIRGQSSYDQRKR